MDEIVDRKPSLRRAQLGDVAKLSPLGRAHAWFDLMFTDHGILRLFYLNRHRVSDRVWRSAQPTPQGLRREKRRGFRTIICVRGSFPFRPWPLEQEACERYGLALFKMHIRGREAPSKGELLALIDLLETAEYPLLIHCKSGADRTGFVAAVYLLAIEKDSPENALAQLSLRYGHLRTSRAGILREVIKAYVDDGVPHGLTFRQWVETGYNRQAVVRRFMPRAIAVAITDVLLRREG
jgi:protein tyrosine phosphatase (PTP) superfamily phosphohydrolase (DUF442 family)